MSTQVIHFTPDGARTIHDDGGIDLLALGFEPPRRASHVEPIQEGLWAGWWLVDFSPLGRAYQFIMWPPFKTRKEALAAEHQWLEENWL